jgi:26S proteasome regulatory subunit N5
MVRLCRERNDWEKLNSTLMVINKRRAQGKVAVTAIVEEALSYVDQTPSQTEKVALIQTLMDVCEGKIYVEAECARLHLMLAFIYEGNGEIEKACETIQDVHVETYGSIPREEKAEYILHQTRLNLLNKDYVRALIQSRKMNRKTIEESSFMEVKVKFYRLMVQYYSHEKDAWEISQCFYKVRQIRLASEASERSEPPSCLC